MNQLSRNNTVLLHATILLVAISSSHGLFNTELWLPPCAVMARSTPVVWIDANSKEIIIIKCFQIAANGFKLTVKQSPTVYFRKFGVVTQSSDFATRTVRQSGFDSWWSSTARASLQGVTESNGA